jgi:hypothetical protein
MASHCYFVSKNCAKNLTTLSGQTESLNVESGVHVISNVCMDQKSKGSNLCVLGTAVPTSLQSLLAVSLDTTSLPLPRTTLGLSSEKLKNFKCGPKTLCKSCLCVLPLAISAAQGLRASNGRGASTPVPLYRTTAGNGEVCNELLPKP